MKVESILFFDRADKNLLSQSWDVKKLQETPRNSEKKTPTSSFPELFKISQLISQSFSGWQDAAWQVPLSGVQHESWFRRDWWDVRCQTGSQLRFVGRHDYPPKIQLTTNQQHIRSLWQPRLNLLLVMSTLFLFGHVFLRKAHFDCMENVLKAGHLQIIYRWPFGSTVRVRLIVSYMGNTCVLDIAVVTALKLLLAQQLGEYQVKSCFLADQFSTLKICSPKLCLTWPGRSNAIYGSYKPAVQVGMQPPTACHLGEGMPTLLNGRLPPTLLTAWRKPKGLGANVHSAECRQGVACRRRLAWWWQVWIRG